MCDKFRNAFVLSMAFAAGLFAAVGQALADGPIVAKAPAAALSAPSGSCTSGWGFLSPTVS